MFNPQSLRDSPGGALGSGLPKPLASLRSETFGSVFLIYTTSKASPYGPNRYPSSRATL